MVKRSAHLAGLDYALVKVAPVLERTGDFTRFARQPIDEDRAYAALRRAETIDRPTVDPCWLRAPESQTGHIRAPGNRGRKPIQRGIE